MILAALLEPVEDGGFTDHDTRTHSTVDPRLAEESQSSHQGCDVDHQSTSPT
jgi:hypothetical protein